MKENARKFRLLSRRFDLGVFESVTINDEMIVFCGKFSSEVARFLDSMKFKSWVSTSGNIVFSRSNLLIILS